MSGAEEDRKRAARAEQVALFRYQLIREAADPALSTRQRGRLVRDLAARTHPGPFGDPVSVSRETIDRWIRAWRAGGFAALAPPARQVTPRTGEVGCGKTVAARAAVAALDQTRHTLIYMANPTTGTRGIHYQIVTALGGRPCHGTAALVAQAAGLLAAEHNERGRVPVLILDEGHLLQTDQLESVRMLTNDQMDAASPLACVLIGQPTLRRMIRLGVLAALDQRIGLRYAMPPMTPAETTSYIGHHLKLAGRSDPLFSDDAITLIHEAARGLPRAVNNIGLQALVAAYAGRKAIVDHDSAHAAVAEVTSD